jgi:cell surface protein SprA
MKDKITQIFPTLFAASLILVILFSSFAGNKIHLPLNSRIFSDDDSTKKDTIKVRYKVKNDLQDPMDNDKGSSMDLQDPPLFKTNLELDSSLNNYRVSKRMNGYDFGDEKELSLKEYLDEDNKKWQRDYFKERAKAQNFVQGSGSSLIPQLNIKTPKIISDIIGGSIDIKPRGSAELIFSADINRVKNPSWPLRQQRNSQFKFDQKIKLNVMGSIGDKISLGLSYDTESAFDFDNEINLRYEAKPEDDGIVRLIEAGNVSLPVQGSLITGSSSLFGIKTKLQFGRLTVTSVFSQQKSEKKEVTLENGAQRTNFDLSALDYDANKHFFLNQYFRNNVYEQAMVRLPVLTTSVQITRIEVWVVNNNASTFETRNIVAFMDLGEPKPWNTSNDNPEKGNFVVSRSTGGLPDNSVNTLYDSLRASNLYRDNKTASSALAALDRAPANFHNGQDYIKIDNARKLQPTEYTYNDKLGYISLNQRIEPGYALAVAYEYTFNGARYQVGEFAQDLPPNPNNPNVLFLKLLKGIGTRTDLPLWDLMMKNIYSLGAYQVQANEFLLDIIYEDAKTGAKLTYLPEPSEPKLAGKLLLQVLGLDRLNTQQEESPDGVFDFLENITIQSGTGKIIFPVLEPFGSELRKKFSNPELADKYAYDAIYDSTQVQAEQLKQFDKFYLRGHYLGSSSSEISLNAINIPEGSVQVTAGGRLLQENVDYTVDYTLGRVKIINESILNSGQVIKVSAESNTMFAIQEKTLMGSRFDYKINEDFSLGSTFLYLKEKPLTHKVNIGSEPINNVIIGFDGNYRTDSRFLTKLVDKIPFIETKEESEVSFTGEYARIIPGHPKVIGPDGVSYIDDFEGSEVPYDLRTRTYWVLASTPQGQADIWPHGSDFNKWTYNKNRAKIAWYRIDPDVFYRNRNNVQPPNVNDAMISQHSMREVVEQEVFPNKQYIQGQPQTIRTFDIAFYPKERGQFNYNVDEFLPSGRLKNPENNWAGIMRRLETNDFEAANIEYIEFWVMDPFATNPDPNYTGGKVYVQLGDVSEDILRDGVKFFENGMPKDGDLSKTNQTAWGLVPTATPINYAFDNDPDARAFQDVGIDGLNDEQERLFFKEQFLDSLKNILNPTAYAQLLSDPSGDNYHFFRGADYDNLGYDILQRYKNYNCTQGNTPVSSQAGSSDAGSLSPDVEDINNDFTLNEIESYYQYVIDIKRNMQVGEGYVTDKLLSTKTLPDNTTASTWWYQFKIPVRNYDKRIGQIRDFKSIRFMRLLMNEFNDYTVLRFARMQLVRGDWRRYLYNLRSESEGIISDPVDSSLFAISTVNIEANGQRLPIPYVLPPGIEREKSITTTQILERNEQSLALNTCLADGDARAVYKNTSFDVRTYKRLKMYVHAEGEDLQYGELTLFLRLGTDFTSNYYEYEIPLYPTPYGETNPEYIWSSINEIDIAFKEFFKIKQQRETTPGISLLERYSGFDSEGKGLITVKGNPDLSNVKTIMIGVRNPSKSDPFNRFADKDDGQYKCGEIWVNELRVTDFDETGGWAAIASVSAKLADFARLTVSGNRTTIGYGGIEQKLQDRSKEDIKGYDIQSYTELGKFFPQKAGFKIPMYYSYSQQISRPQYNPLSPDILLDARLELAESKEERDSIKNAVENVVTRKSLNFMNVQKTRQGSKQPKIYDIENFMFSYAYSNLEQRDYRTEMNDLESHKLIVNYAYTFREKYLTPLSKLSKKQSLKLITDFNIGIRPQSFSFRTEIDSRFGITKYRNTGEVVTNLQPIFSKNYTMKRIYDFRHNLSRSLKLSYSATADAYLEYKEDELNRKKINDNFYKSGRLKEFNQKTSLSYDVPFRKIPLTNFITTRITYTGSYNWSEGPPSLKDSLGNLIQNSAAWQVNSQLNMVTLYSKIPLLKNISRGRSNLADIKKKKLKELQEREKAKGNEDWKELTTDDVVMNEGLFNLWEAFLRFVTSLKNININYSITDGTVLPGFMHTPDYLGNNFRNNAPGIPFVTGWQENLYDLQMRGIDNDWFSVDTSFNQLFRTTHTKNFTLQSLIEPIKDLKINVEMNHRVSNNHQEIFGFREYDPETNLYDPDYYSMSPTDNGSFSMSILTIRTAFNNKKDGNNIPDIYRNFENNRYVISQRLATGNQRDTTSNYFMGYSGTSQQVIIPAFLAAYTGKNANSVPLGLFLPIPAPNWRISYNGLSKLDIFSEIAKNININHSYRATYTISNFASNLSYQKDQVPVMGEDIIPEYNVQQIQISEQLSPLIGLDINWKNNWTTRVEYRTNRNLSFNFANFQTAEVNSKDFTLGLGYRAKEVALPFKIRGKQAVLEHDLTFRLDFTIKNQSSYIIRLDEDRSESVGGNRIITFKPVVDYVLNQNLMARVFMTFNNTKPAISTSYPTSFFNAGFSIRYTLGQ